MFDDKKTFTFTLMTDAGHYLDTQKVRATDQESALRLLRAGGFLDDDEGVGIRVYQGELNQDKD